MTVKALFQTSGYRTVKFIDWNYTLLDSQLVFFRVETLDPITRPNNPIRPPSRPSDDTINVHWWDTFTNVQNT